ncbi:hypothetical protein GCM10011344_34800 [Dokdonia pacifica]|uniref:TonB C-terminal domain-containing protein n=1 Tax=Dokdonia pacifica TaxID=1627892 RepID=A0A239ANU6_9FLAO|nr:hypothetical protein [Dokdonia pacifica]GGG30898.1 hypothetical protein GCM10011344_34800 [Dokdonia pacifica]SNR97031.1 hypothetical protein SAMN06265376_10526 [Dokdonia pacifica]
MNKYTLRILTLLFLVPTIAIGQIPNGYFLDADDTATSGYKAKPYKQEKEGIYHYAVLTELPFENKCSEGLSEKDQSDCAEASLRNLIYPNIPSELDFKGNVYVYLTVKKDAQIANVTVSSYPTSKTINSYIKEAIEAVTFKPGKFNDKIVTSRLWTSFTFPSSSKELFSVSLKKMKEDKNPTYEDYENLVFDASQYIFSNPVYPDGTEFKAATQIVGFWMNKNTGMNLPTFGDFFTSLTNRNQQQFLYTVAMINYGLDQKINHDRVLKCVKIEGQKYSEQEDVKEVQLEGAKILLAFIGNEKNNVLMSSKARKFYKAYEKGVLEEKLFD